MIWHDDVIKWKHFPRYWAFVRGIHRSPVNSPHKDQWRVALIFSLISARINAWVNNREAGALRRIRPHDVTVMERRYLFTFSTQKHHAKSHWTQWYTNNEVDLAKAHRHVILHCLTPLLHQEFHVRLYSLKTRSDLAYKSNINQIIKPRQTTEGYLVWSFQLPLTPATPHPNITLTVLDSWWRHQMLRHWPFVRGIRRPPVNSCHNGQWRGALNFTLICAWTNIWANNQDARDLRRHRIHYGSIVMLKKHKILFTSIGSRYWIVAGWSITHNMDKNIHTANNMYASH